MTVRTMTLCVAMLALLAPGLILLPPAALAKITPPVVTHLPYPDWLVNAGKPGGQAMVDCPVRATVPTPHGPQPSKPPHFALNLATAPAYWADYSCKETTASHQWTGGQFWFVQIARGFVPAATCSPGITRCEIVVTRVCSVTGYAGSPQSEPNPAYNNVGPKGCAVYSSVFQDDICMGGPFATPPDLPVAARLCAQKHW
jgi:hypothetical protein